MSSSYDDLNVLIESIYSYFKLQLEAGVDEQYALDNSVILLKSQYKDSVNSLEVTDEYIKRKILEVKAKKERLGFEIY